MADSDQPASLRRVRALIGAGDPLLALEVADEAVVGELGPTGHVQLDYLRALALARAGALGSASAALAELNDAVADDSALAEDIAALSARLVKDRALRRSGADRVDGFEEAARRYDNVYRRYKRPYSAINAASMFLLAGRRERGQALAAKAQALLDVSEEDDYWALATRAEAALIQGDTVAASAWLSQASALAPDALGTRASTLAQLRLVCEAIGEPWELILAPLANPDVVHFCGHRIAAPGQDGRFATHEEPRVRAEVRAALTTRRTACAHGSLAAGADIIVAEEALRAGIELFVVLPFAEDEFVETSVRPSGMGWVDRYRQCVAAATRVVVTCDSAYRGDDSLYGYAAQVAMGQAINRARGLASTAWQLAIWDGEPTGLPAGTAHDIEVWAGTDHDTHVVQVQGVAGLSADPAPLSGTSSRVERRPVRALLFGDMLGFSGLRDHEIDAFIEHVLGLMAVVLDRHATNVIDRNTWGDGLFVAFTDPLAAARCALDIQEGIAHVEPEALNLPTHAQMRISVHAGPVMQRTDPVRRIAAVFGREVTRAARIEPLTPPGDVYATSAFAALLTLDPNADVTPEYVGMVTTAKGFETIPMYVLHRTGH